MRIHGKDRDIYFSWTEPLVCFSQSFMNKVDRGSSR